MVLEWLHSIAQHLWISDFIAWGIFFWFAIADRRVSSSAITLTIVLVLDGVMNQYSAFVLGLAAPENKTLVRALYYIGLALFDALAIVAIYKTHKACELDYKFIANLYLLSYLAMAMLQLARFAERLYFDTDYLKMLHRTGIESINLVTAAAGLTVALATVYMHLSKKHVGGTIWKI